MFLRLFYCLIALHYEDYEMILRLHGYDQLVQRTEQDYRNRNQLQSNPLKVCGAAIHPAVFVLILSPPPELRDFRQNKLWR